VQSLLNGKLEPPVDVDMFSCTWKALFFRLASFPLIFLVPLLSLLEDMGSIFVPKPKKGI
jgi:hypothetical protein